MSKRGGISQLLADQTPGSMQSQTPRSKPQSSARSRPRIRAFRLFQKLQRRWSLVRTKHQNELGQISVRLAIGAIIGIYISSVVLKHGVDAPLVSGMLAVYVATLSLAFALLLHLLWSGSDSKLRRNLAVVLDIGSLSLFLYFGETHTAPFFPVYLWITLASGFRFGERILVWAAGLSLISFAAVTAATSFWQEHLSLAIGIMVALVTMPAYVYHLLKRLTETRVQAEQANEAKGRFLATMSHEIRTPLNAITGLTDILRASRLNAEQRQMVRSIGMSASSLLILMADILNFSKIEAGGVQRKIESFSLYELMASIDAIIATQARMKGLSFSLTMQPGVPPLLKGDHQHLHEILVNVGANAVKYTNSGSINFSVAREDGGGSLARLVFTISDTGIGIAPAQRSHIFESFTQVDSTNTGAERGVGLGLAICKRLVKIMGGRIEVESEEDQGSTFTISVPFEVESAVSDAADIRLESASVICFGLEKDIIPAIQARGVALADHQDVENFAELNRATALRMREGSSRPIVFVSAEALKEAGLQENLANYKETFSFLPVVILIEPQARAALHGLRGLHTDADMVVSGHKVNPLINALAYASALSNDTQQVYGAEVIRAPAGELSLTGLHILVAEDNRVNRTVAAKILGALGHEVSLAEDGEKALDALRENKFDLVFMDVNMPVLDGIEATQLLRYAEMGNEHTPVIALTADATPEARERCLAAGMDDVVHKPVSKASLDHAIGRLAALRPELAQKSRAMAGAAGDGTAEAEAAGVEGSEIATHPRFQNARPAILDLEKLEELKELDESGAFLADVASEFIEDAASLVESFRPAVASGDIALFLDINHALRSCAANVGALRIFQRCDSNRKFTASDLKKDGPAFIEDLEKDLMVTAEELQRTIGRPLVPASKAK